MLSKRINISNKLGEKEKRNTFLTISVVNGAYGGKMYLDFDGK